jgi:hypothetical protein
MTPLTRFRSGTGKFNDKGRGRPVANATGRPLADANATPRFTAPRR